jgi:hypothetical protein
MSIEHSRSRFGFLASLAIVASVAAACGSSTATPGITYVIDTPTPAPSTPLDTPTAVPTDAPTDSPTDSPSPTPTPTPAPTPVVTSVLITSAAPDGRWTVKYHKPVVAGVSAAAVTAVNNSIKARLTALVDDFNGHGLPVPASGDGPSTFDGNFTVALNSPTILSIRIAVDEFVTGAAHPSHIAATLNFKVSDGSTIALQDLFSNLSGALSVMSLKSRTLLVAQLGAGEAGTINTGTTPALASFDSAWAFTTGGLELTFQEYSIGPYADGSPTIVIPWSDLAGDIKQAGPAGEFIP